MYNLISLPRNTLKMTEKLICESLEKNTTKQRVWKVPEHSCQEKRALSCAFGHWGQQLAGGVSSQERLWASLLEQKASALWRDQVFQTATPLVIPTGAVPASGGSLLTAWPQWDSPGCWGAGGQFGSPQALRSLRSLLWGCQSPQAVAGLMGTEGRWRGREWPLQSRESQALCQQAAPRSTPAACWFWSISAVNMRQTVFSLLLPGLQLFSKEHCDTDLSRLNCWQVVWTKDS